MSGTADYTIQGFLYQFNKTILEILKAPDSAKIVVEGIIEDIDVEGAAEIEAIQCKYHEANQKYSLSAIYKPILQMMLHFHHNSSSLVKYVLYAHFPQQEIAEKQSLSKDELEAVLKSKANDLKKYTDKLKDKINLEEFIKRFSLQFGATLNSLVSEVHAALKDCGIPEGDIEYLAYPNAIHTMATLSICHDPNKRKITKSELINNLKKIKKTIVSRWTLSLRTRKQILTARRKQLKPNLDKNARLRYFLINQKAIDDFDSEIVVFISDYLEKYHFKTAHIMTPLICLDSTKEAFDGIQLRLHQKGVVSTNGFVVNHFDENWFFREPMSRKEPPGRLRKEFSIRLLLWKSHWKVLNERKADDLFILSSDDYDDLDTADVNVETLGASSLKEIRFLLGVSNVCE